MGEDRYKGCSLATINPFIIKSEDREQREKNIPGTNTNNLINNERLRSSEGKIRLKYKNNPAISAEPTGVNFLHSKASLGE